MTNRSLFIIVALSALLCMGSVSAQEITPTPGTYELLEGKSMQFDARQKTGKTKAERFEWQIIAGDGAKLLNPMTSRVVFVAPDKITEDSRNFTLQLTSHYPKGQKSSRAQINIRVHRKTKDVKVRKTSPWVHGSVGFGFGYLWGGWWRYPPVIIIPPAPPGEIWPPEEVPPVAVPLPEDPSYGDWARDNPDIVESYLGEVDVVAEPLPAGTPIVEAEVPTAIQPVESEPDLSIEPVPMPAPIEPEYAPETMPAPEPMDIPEPMDMPMMDMPMDEGGFD